MIRLRSEGAGVLFWVLAFCLASSFLSNRLASFSSTRSDLLLARWTAGQAFWWRVRGGPPLNGPAPQMQILECDFIGDKGGELAAGGQGCQ